MAAKSTRTTKSVKATKTTKSTKPTKTAKATKSTKPTKIAKSTKPTRAAKNSGPRKELLSLLEELDAEEVAWLVTQARTIIYNHKVIETNEAAVNLANAKNRSASAQKKSARKSKAAGLSRVDIEQSGNSKNFNILVGNARLFLNLGELKSLVKIAQSNKSLQDGTANLYRWMLRERKDMINDAGFSGPGDSRLAAVCAILKDRYTMG